MKHKYSNAKVEHSFNCSSLSCLLQETEPKHEHCSVVHFDTQEVSYCAETLTEAAKMWAADGQKDLHNVGRVG